MEQVSHDIRSPLTLIEGMADSLTRVPEVQRVALHNAAVRIMDIANYLLFQYKNTDNAIDYQTKTILLSANLLGLLHCVRNDGEKLKLYTLAFSMKWQ